MSRPVPNNPFGNDEDERLINESVINYMEPSQNADPSSNAAPFGYQQAVPVINSDPPSNRPRYMGWTLITVAAFLVIAFLILIVTLFVKLIEFMGVYTLVAILILVGLLAGLVWWRRNNPPDTGYNPI